MLKSVKSFLSLTRERFPNPLIAFLMRQVSAKTSSLFARIVIFTLVGIHLILPFTPVNTHPEQRIVIASLILGVLFLSLGLASFKRPYRSFLTALVLLLAVYVISAVSGASSWQEGLVVKVLFVAGLIYGLLGARGANVDGT